MLDFMVILSPLTIYLAKFTEKMKILTAYLEIPHISFPASGLKVGLGQLHFLPYNQVHKNELLYLDFNSGGTKYFMGKIFS